MKRLFMLTAQFLGGNLWPLRLSLSVGVVVLFYNPPHTHTLCLLMELTVADAQLVWTGMIWRSQLLSETFLKFENDRPFLLLVKPQQTSPFSFAHLVLTHEILAVNSLNPVFFWSCLLDWSNFKLRDMCLYEQPSNRLLKCVCLEL